jgi:hypothetical protein
MTGAIFNEGNNNFGKKIEHQQQMQYLNDNIIRNIELLRSQIKDWKKKVYIY